MSHAVMHYSLEVAVTNVTDAATAWRNGADRIELNVALELGGLTPSLGLVTQVRRAVPIPIIVMVRPRGAGFRYSEPELEVIRDDIERMIAAGADGCAVGALRADGSIHVEAVHRFRECLKAREFVFHRAFDVTPDLPAALASLIEAGVDRVLTSGGAATADEGRAVIAQLRAQSRGRIGILPGAGIRPGNAVRLLRETNCDQLHGTFRASGQDIAAPVADSQFPRLDARLVHQMRAVLDDFASGCATDDGPHPPGAADH